MMALVDAESFAAGACSRIYIAGRLREAKHVEQVLSERGIDYTVAVEKFRKYLLGVIPGDHEGAAFYVEHHLADTSREALSAAGLRAGLVEEEAG